MNLYLETKNGNICPELEYISEVEKQSIDYIQEHLINGQIVIIKNNNHNIKPIAVGHGLKTKVNANIGSSPDHFNLDIELKKLEMAIESGADTVMDLSTGGNLIEFRQKILEYSTIPLGTVPLYEMAHEMSFQKKAIMDMEIEDYLRVIQRQAEEGVDFMTIHAGVTRSVIESLNSQERIIGITSRGGSIIASWMKHRERENPLYEYYDDIIDILAKNNVAISLGDGLRPGAIYEANDRAQIHEMIILGDLAERAKKKGVQAIIEGPGHMPLNLIADNMRLEKTLCNGAPYYVLGPLVTDIAPGYDHITSAIGGAIAAASGADFLCYVTPAEHLRLPTVEDVKEGVIASRIAAHAADIVKLGDKAKNWDDQMSRARKKRDWNEMFKLAIDKDKAKAFRDELPSSESDQCSMCGEFCAIKRDY